MAAGTLITAGQILVAAALKKLRARLFFIAAPPLVVTFLGLLLPGDWAEAVRVIFFVAYAYSFGLAIFTLPHAIAFMQGVIALTPLQQDTANKVYMGIILGVGLELAVLGYLMLIGVHFETMPQFLVALVCFVGGVILFTWAGANALWAIKLTAFVMIMIWASLSIDILSVVFTGHIVLEHLGIVSFTDTREVRVIQREIDEGRKDYTKADRKRLLALARIARRNNDLAALDNAQAALRAYEHRFQTSGAQAAAKISNVPVSTWWASVKNASAQTWFLGLGAYVVASIGASIALKKPRVRYLSYALVGSIGLLLVINWLFWGAATAPGPVPAPTPTVVTGTPVPGPAAPVAGFKAVIAKLSPTAAIAMAMGTVLLVVVVLLAAAKQTQTGTAGTAGRPTFAADLFRIIVGLIVGFLLVALVGFCYWTFFMGGGDIVRVWLHVP